MLPAVYLLANALVGDGFELGKVSDGDVKITIDANVAFLCVGSGVCGGLIIGLITEYYTSSTYAPVREVADACKTGAATNIIYGTALGYKSAVIPVTILSSIVYLR